MTFAIVFHGQSTATAKPLLYTDDPAAVRLLIAYLADQAESAAGIVPGVRLEADTEPSDRAAEA